MNQVNQRLLLLSYIYAVHPGLKGTHTPESSAGLIGFVNLRFADDIQALNFKGIEIRRASLSAASSSREAAPAIA